ncbi:MAG: type II secretion system protein [Candidatus Paceibacterota bacterium]
MYLSKQKRTGFTLTELLVVIAIISVLSTIVLFNVNLARNKGKNARAVADVSQYLTGLALARERAANNQYPGTTSWACLGGSGCIWPSTTFTTANNELVNNPLREVMPSLPTSTYTESGYGGYQYQRYNSGYRIRWFLYGKDRKCEIGEQTGGNDSITLCAYSR